MRVLWVFAHPERRSLGGSLYDEALSTLRAQGHEVRTSDLYAMNWNPVVTGEDFDHQRPGDRLVVAAASKRAYRDGALADAVDFARALSAATAGVSLVSSR